MQNYWKSTEAVIPCPSFYAVLYVKLQFFKNYYGSHRKACRILGFNQKTYWQWYRGINYPKSPSMKRIDTLYAELYASEHPQVDPDYPNKKY